MSEIKQFKFVYQEDILIPFNINETIQSLLSEFLKRTNSRQVLDIEKISFMCNTNIINKKENLPKKIRDVIKGNFPQFTIKIRDTDNIIGGKA